MPTSAGWAAARAEAQRTLARLATVTREYDEGQHPRDEHGRWTDSGGGGDGGGKETGGEGAHTHPGEGYSKSAYVDDKGVIHTANVNDAARALHENRKVELKQPRQVSTLIHKLGAEAQKMQKAGQQAPTFNLCNVSVAGTNLFCADTKGIPRVQMPQLDDQQTKDFRKYLKDKGYKVTKEKSFAAHLRATQNELNGAKVAAVMDHLADKDGHQSKRLIVSADDYILDGHHHWAGKLGLDAADGNLTNDTKMKIARVDIPITKLLEEAETFTGGKGKKPASESAFGKGLNLENTAMPMLPHKGESKDDFMKRCVPEMVGTGKDKRPNDQAVAICLDIFSRPKPGAKAKAAGDDEGDDDSSMEIDDSMVDPPDEDEDRDDFLDRCVDSLTEDGNVDDDEAQDHCEMMWEERAARAARRRATSDDKPYGDVEYADPGYQKDGKKRYPLDTEDHIRAAWSYINQEKNQQPYTSDQVDKIKGKIVAAWKKKIDPAGPPGAKSTKQVEVDPPGDAESYSDFMDRCVGSLVASGGDEWSADRASDYCSVLYEESQVPPGQERGLRTSPWIHKTHAGPVNGLEYILSDESVDRMGDVISAAGWDLTNFARNPIALFNHRADFPIGKWERLRVENGALRGHLVLAPKGTSPRIDEIRRLIDADILRAVSVGFKPIESQPRKSGLTIDGGGGYLGEHYTKQELVETSLVSVPANPNALAVAKSLQISPATLDIVFAKTGRRNGAARAKGLNGKTADRHPPGRGTRTMEGPLAKRIEESQQRLVRLRDDLTTHLGKINDDNVSDADLTVTQELNHKITQAEKTYESLVESEKRLAATSETRAVADGGGGGNGDGRATGLVVSNARPFAVAAKKIKPIEYIWRSLTVAIKHHQEGHKRPILEVMKDTYGEDEPTKLVMGLVTRAPSAPATIPQAGWAAELVTQVWADFLEALLPYSVFPEISRRGTAFTFGRNGVINLPLRNSTPALSGSFVGEGAPIPVRQGSFASAQLTPKKMAVISTFTREISEHSTPAIEGIIREAIQNDTAVAIDSVLLDANPATAIRPPGLLNGVVGLTPTTGGTILALIGDITQLVGALSAATLGNIRNPVWIMSPTTALKIALTPTAVEGMLPFRDEVARGTLMSIPIVKSASVPANYVILMDAADFASATEAAPRFDVSDQAVLHMEDTTPAAITGGTPSPAVPVRSLWQTDTIGVRMILPMNWIMRRAGMVQYISSHTW